MTMDAWHLPWQGSSVPHALLDIIRGCNISCGACYNMRPPVIKTLAEIRIELDLFQSRRRVSAVSIAGGEPLLHPALCDVVREVKSRNLVAQIFTNAVLLNDEILRELKQAGTDIIFIHIESGQTRTDLPADPSREQLLALWDSKTGQIARHGIDVGMTMTVFPDRLSEARDMLAYLIDSPYVSYALLTLYRDTQRFAGLHGNIRDGIRGSVLDHGQRKDTLTNPQMIDYLHNELQMQPFAFLGSNRSAEDPRWLSYMVATARSKKGVVVRHSVKASLFEKAFCELIFRMRGAYPMYRRQRLPELIVQLLGNAASGGDIVGNLKFLLQALRAGSRLHAKRLLFQWPAEIEADGSLTHCENCPDAVLMNGEFVPVCIADRVISSRSGN